MHLTNVIAIHSWISGYLKFYELLKIAWRRIWERVLSKYGLLLFASQYAWNFDIRSGVFIRARPLEVVSGNFQVCSSEPLLLQLRHFFYRHFSAITSLCIMANLPVSRELVELILADDALVVMVAYAFIWPDVRLPRLVSNTARVLINLDLRKFISDPPIIWSIFLN